MEKHQGKPKGFKKAPYEPATVKHQLSFLFIIAVAILFLIGGVYFIGGKDQANHLLQSIKLTFSFSSLRVK